MTVESVLAGNVVLASHPIITAVPFFVPTFAVVAVVGFIIWRDRRRSGDEEPDVSDDSSTARSDDAGK